jgi:hypothetical protein
VQSSSLLQAQREKDRINVYSISLGAEILLLVSLKITNTYVDHVAVSAEYSKSFEAVDNTSVETGGAKLNISNKIHM